jgi:hypothetical protein
VHVAFYDKGGVLKPGLNLAYNGTGKNEIVIPQAGLGTKSVASAAPRPLRIQLDLGEDLRYYVEGIIDDQDEFKAGIGRLSR